MDLSNVKLIVSDMDGTLLDSRHKLDSSFFNLYPLLKSKGITFAVASGRQYANLLKHFGDIANDMYFVPENGSFVVRDGEELLVRALDRRYVEEIIALTRKIENAHIVFCGRHKAYIENADPEFMKNFQLYFEAYEVVDDLLNVDDDCLKVSICITNGGTAHDIYSAYEHYFDKLQIKVSGTIWLDAAHLLSNKGNAVAMLQERLNISREQTMAFGDFMNDIEMLQQAHFSFAMANALPDVKKVAAFEAESNDCGGVYKILKKVIEA